MMYGYAKYERLQQVLQQFYEKKEPVNDLVQLKMIILYLEVLIQQRTFHKAVEVLNFLEDQKYQIMSVFSQIPCEEKKVSSANKEQRKQNFFTSIFFASEINRHEEPVSLVNRYEFNLILSYFRIQIFARLDELALAKQVPLKTQSFKFMKQQINLLLQVIQ